MRISFTVFVTAAIALGLAGSARGTFTVTARSTQVDVHLNAANAGGTYQYEDSEGITTFDPYDDSVDYFFQTPIDFENPEFFRVGAVASQRSFFYPIAASDEFAIFAYGDAVVIRPFVGENFSGTMSAASTFQTSFHLSQTYVFDASVWTEMNTLHPATSALVSLSDSSGVLYSFGPAPDQPGGGVIAVLPAGTYTLSAAAHAVGVGDMEDASFARYGVEALFTPIPEPVMSSVLIVAACAVASLRRRRRGL